MRSPSSRERLGLLLGFVGMAIFGGTLPMVLHTKTNPDINSRASTTS